MRKNDISDVSRSRVTKIEVMFLVVAAALLLFSSVLSTANRSPVASSETRFVESSRNGLNLVPASCPSYPHFAADCACTQEYFCSGNTQMYRYGDCTTYALRECPYGCENGLCLEDEGGLKFVPFDAEGGAGTHFMATGELQARPSLVRTGETTRVYWNVVNAQSCTVTGTNGDSWTGSFSSTTGKVTGTISEKTVYTLNCSAAEGVLPINLTDTATVTVLPLFEDQ